MPVDTQIVEDVDSLAEVVPRWDELAVAANRPWCAPSWLLAWWRHAREGDAHLRVVLVRDGGRTVGIGPIFVQHGGLGLAEYRFLGAGNFHRLEPLTEPGREDEVVTAIARTLAGATPTPSSLVLEGFDERSSWPARLRSRWPSRIRPRLRCDLVLPAPVLHLPESGERWLAGRSSNFRQQLARRRRRLERAGAEVRCSETPDELSRDLDRMFALHHARWRTRGGSGALTAGMERAIRAAATSPAIPVRARLWLLEIDGTAIAAQLFAWAGDEIAYWGGGLDPSWQHDAPGIQLHAREIELACARGAKRIDYGGGDHPYKRRLADDDDPVAWRTLFPVGARYPLTRAQLAPKQVRTAARTAARRLPEPVQRRLRELRRGVA
jgi:CelD/BcsL family acetyltransferase involved in cellulose biosynthesis